MTEENLSNENQEHPVESFEVSPDILAIRDAGQKIRGAIKQVIVGQVPPASSPTAGARGETAIGTTSATSCPTGSGTGCFRRDPRASWTRTSSR